MKMMTMKERMLAVIQGNDAGCVPFVQYDNFVAPNEEVWSLIGRDNMGVLRWSGIHEFRHPKCHFESKYIERNGLRGQMTTLYTPKGLLTEEKFFDPTYGAASIKKHYISEPEDYEVFMAYLHDIIVYENLETYLRGLHEVGEDGIPMIVVRQTPYQQLWVDWVSLMDFSLHMSDHPDLIEECISLLTQIELRIFEIIYKALDKIPVYLVNIPDNITAPVIGPHNFLRYCVPLYNKLADMLSCRNIPVAVHMDGDLKPLWKAIGDSKVTVLDSFSPFPDNDTSVAEAIALWPDKKLFVNFPSSVHMDSPDAIYAQASKILEESGHTGRIWIQISENVPPGIWKKSFPQIVKAIAEY